MIRRQTRHSWIPIWVVAIGAALSALVIVLWSMPGIDVARLALVAGGTAAVGAVAATVLLRVVPRRSFAAQTTAAALTAVVPALLGVWAGGEAMVLPTPDIGALIVIMVAAGTVAVATAVILGHRVGIASDDLVGAARRIGDGAANIDGMRVPAPEELARLYRELSLASERLSTARARERLLDASRRELVAWVSHDLRTPLAGIRALAEALEDRVADDPETVARYHTALRVEADRLNGLVDDLFELSRTQAGVLRLEFERVSWGDLVSDAIASATPIAEAKGVRLHGHLSSTAVEVEASASEVLRALRNILENAIRHTPTDGTVTVRAGTERDRAVVTVIDTGGGIPEHDLPRIFDVAFRGDPARTPGEGAGLGLAIARGLVEAHCGDITVANHNGGARFTVCLPLSESGKD